MFSELLQKWLKYKNMGKKELAMKYGCNPSFISQLISGRTQHPYVETKKKLAEIFGVSYDDFLKGPTENNVNAIVNDLTDKDIVRARIQHILYGIEDIEILEKVLNMMEMIFVKEGDKNES